MVERSDALKAFEGLSAIWKAPDSVGKGKGNKENQQEDVYRGADESLALRSALAQSGTSMVAKGSHWVRVDLQEILSFEVCLDESRSEGGYQVQRCQKCKDGESDRSKQDGEGWWWVEKGTHDEPGRDGDEGDEQEIWQWSCGWCRCHVCKWPRPRQTGS